MIAGSVAGACGSIVCPVVRPIEAAVIVQLEANVPRRAVVHISPEAIGIQPVVVDSHRVPAVGIVDEDLATLAEAVVKVSIDNCS